MNHCNKTRTTSLKIVFFFSLKTGSKHEQKLKAIYKVNKKTEEKKIVEQQTQIHTRRRFIVHFTVFDPLIAEQSENLLDSKFSH